MKNLETPVKTGRVGRYVSVSECSALKYISNFKKSRKIMITDTNKSSGNNSIMEILQVVYFFIFCVSLSCYCYCCR